MKIALGHRVKVGPWGGGNRFAQALAEALSARGDQVVNSLDDRDIDLILITDPRSRNPSVPFSLPQIFSYLRRNPLTVVVHRINECDERKGTQLMNAKLRIANYLADHTVFISEWLMDMDVWLRQSPASVLRNGGDVRTFHSQGQTSWAQGTALRLVTHHWGGHAGKGFDLYAKIDQIISRPEWRDRLMFTYIGNLPPGFRFRNARHLAPLDGLALATELRSHHAYVTASLNEPAGMHHIEGALCGLPLIFRNSGALPEYCCGFGEMFESPDDFTAALIRLTSNYSKHTAALQKYPHTASRMCETYLALFDNLLAERRAIAGRRKLWRSPLRAALLHLPI